MKEKCLNCASYDRESEFCKAYFDKCGNVTSCDRKKVNVEFDIATQKKFAQMDFEIELQALKNTYTREKLQAITIIRKKYIDLRPKLNADKELNIEEINRKLNALETDLRCCKVKKANATSDEQKRIAEIELANHLKVKKVEERKLSEMRQTILSGYITTAKIYSNEEEREIQESNLKFDEEYLHERQMKLDAFKAKWEKLQCE